jgi:hypothetical protein
LRRRSQVIGGARDQGLIDQPLDVAGLFHPSVRNS